MSSRSAHLLLQLFEADALRGSMLIHDGQCRPAHQRHKAPAHLHGKPRQLMQQSSLPHTIEGSHRGVALTACCCVAAAVAADAYPKHPWRDAHGNMLRKCPQRMTHPFLAYRPQTSRPSGKGAEH